MNFFAPPPPTRYDLNFTVLGFPVRVHPLFWVVAAFFGASSNDLVYMVVWIIVVFISILIHELGHAIAMRIYGQPSYIILHGAGGLAVPDTVGWGSGWANVSLSRKEEIIISLAGPFAGFLIAAFVVLVVIASGGAVLMTWIAGVIPNPIAILPFGGGIANILVRMLLWVNIFWGLINLLPVYPLDGGRVAQHVLVGFDPLDGFNKSLSLSMVTGAVIAIAGLFILKSVYMAFLFGFLAFQSYQALQSGLGSRY